MAKIDVGELEGGADLCAWFGSSPSFHDARLSKLELRQDDGGVIVAHIFKSGPELDGDGYYIQTKRAAVTFRLGRLVDVDLHDFMEAGIMDGLDIERNEQGITLTFDSSYGVHGSIRSERVSLSFEPE